MYAQVNPDNLLTVALQIRKATTQPSNTSTVCSILCRVLIGANVILETGFAQIEGLSPHSCRCVSTDNNVHRIATLPGMAIVDMVPILGRLPLFLKPWERKACARFQRDWNWCLQRLDVGLIPFANIWFT